MKEEAGKVRGELEINGKRDWTLYGLKISFRQRGQINDCRIRAAKILRSSTKNTFYENR